MSSQKQLPPKDLTDLPYFTLDMHRRTDADAVEVLLTGDIDALTVGHLDDSLGWIVEHMSQQVVIVDFTGVARVDACAVETLTRFRSMLAADRRTLATCGESPAIADLLGAARLRRPLTTDEQGV